MGAQLDRDESIRHFLGRQAANNPGLCSREESLPMCCPKAPPCQSRKVSSASIMEKRAAKHSWEGGSKKSGHLEPLENNTLSKASIVWGWACKGDVMQICAAAQRGLGTHCVLKEWLGQEGGSSEFGGSQLPCLLSHRPLHLFTFPRRRIRETKKKPAGRVPHPSRFKVSILVLLSTVQDSKLCCKTRIPGWMSTE